jgi:nucleotide-binding universal stress UspA family protein
MSAVGRVIVGTSGSPASLHALRYAEITAHAHHAILIPVIAWEPPGGDRVEAIRPSSYLREEWHKMARQRLREALEAVWGEVPDDPRVQPHVERGPAGWVLVSLADRPDDLLVVGAGRRGILARMASTRVSRYCVARARCPVLAVPPPASARDLGDRRFARVFWHKTLTPESVLRDGEEPAG